MELTFQSWLYTAVTIVGHNFFATFNWTWLMCAKAASCSKTSWILDVLMYIYVSVAGYRTFILNYFWEVYFPSLKKYRGGVSLSFYIVRRRLLARRVATAMEPCSNISLDTFESNLMSLPEHFIEKFLESIVLISRYTWCHRTSVSGVLFWK